MYWVCVTKGKKVTIKTHVKNKMFWIIRNYYYYHYCYHFNCKENN